jgi:predicted transcriptional regulator
MTPALTSCVRHNEDDRALGEHHGDKTKSSTKHSVCETSGSLKVPIEANGSVTLQRFEPNRERFCAIILSINPVFLGWIEDGKKSFEYRKSLPADAFSHILFLDNKAMKLVAIAEVTEALAGSPQEIINLTWRSSGTTPEGLNEYYGERAVGFAIELKNFLRLPEPLSFQEAQALDSNFQRPYSYLFLDRYPAVNSEIITRAGIKTTHDRE